jgi:hypothetical protein
MLFAENELSREFPIVNPEDGFEFNATVGTETKASSKQL